MYVSAQISMYPLKKPHLSPVIDNAVSVLKEHGLEVSPGVMSTLASGTDEDLFSAMREVFQKSSEQGDVVMVVTLSNTCPVA